MGRLTTHVLDQSLGKPASGMRITLWKRDAKGGFRQIRAAVTNRDGRLDEPLLEGVEWTPGVYELVFEAGAYFRRLSGSRPSGTGRRDAAQPFLEEIPVRFCVTDANAHYHIPLLVAPGGYSTYRGS